MICDGCHGWPCICLDVCRTCGRVRYEHDGHNCAGWFVAGVYPSPDFVKTPDLQIATMTKEK